MAWTTPKDWNDQDLVTAALMNQQLSNNLAFLHDNHLPKRALMWHLNSLVTSGSSLMLTSNLADQPFNYYAHQSPPALHNEFTHTFYLQAGTYTFKVLGVKAATAGKVDWYLDDQPFAAGQDWYGNAFNIIQSVTDVVITESGVHRLTGVVSDKNTISTNYSLRLTALWFEPSTD